RVLSLSSGAAQACSWCADIAAAKIRVTPLRSRFAPGSCGKGRVLARPGRAGATGPLRATPCNESTARKRTELLCAFFFVMVDADVGVNELLDAGLVE